VRDTAAGFSMASSMRRMISSQRSPRLIFGITSVEYIALTMRFSRKRLPENLAFRPVARSPVRSVEGTRDRVSGTFSPLAVLIPVATANARSSALLDQGLDEKTGSQLDLCDADVT